MDARRLVADEQVPPDLASSADRRSRSGTCVVPWTGGVQLLPDPGSRLQPPGPRSSPWARRATSGSAHVVEVEVAAPPVPNGFSASAVDRAHSTFGASCAAARPSSTRSPPPSSRAPPASSPVRRPLCVPGPLPPGGPSAPSGAPRQVHGPTRSCPHRRGAVRDRGGVGGHVRDGAAVDPDVQRCERRWAPRGHLHERRCGFAVQVAQMRGLPRPWTAPRPGPRGRRRRHRSIRGSTRSR